MRIPLFVRGALLLAVATFSLDAQGASGASGASGVLGTLPTHGVRPQRLVIRNAMIVDGNGTPARGPVDIVVEGNTITEIVNLDPVAVNRGNARHDLQQITTNGRFSSRETHARDTAFSENAHNPLNLCWR